jgi:hypothetical protein
MAIKWPKNPKNQQRLPHSSKIQSLTHIHDRSLYTDTSNTYTWPLTFMFLYRLFNKYWRGRINSMRPNLLVKWCDHASCRCFPHTSKMPTFTHNRANNVVILCRYLCWWTSVPREYHPSSSKCFGTDIVYYNVIIIKTTPSS